MSRKRLLKSVLVILLIFPVFGYAAMHGLNGYYFNKNHFNDQTCVKPSEDIKYEPGKYESKGPFGSGSGCFYIDKVIDFSWGGPLQAHQAEANIYGEVQPEAKPWQIHHDIRGPQIRANYWSISWEGYLYVPETGMWGFFSKVDADIVGGAKINLWIDEEEYGHQGIVANDWTKLERPEYKGLNKGFHKVKMQYNAGLGNKWVKLAWSKDGSKEKAVVIPTENLYTDKPIKIRFTDENGKPVTSYGQKENSKMKVYVSIDRAPRIGETLEIKYKTKERNSPNPKENATENNDYDRASGVLTFDENSPLTQSFEINIREDYFDEDTEFFDITLSQDSQFANEIETPSALGIIYSTKQSVEFREKTKILTEPLGVLGSFVTYKIPVILNVFSPETVVANIEFVSVGDSYGAAQIGQDYVVGSVNQVVFKPNQTESYVEVSVLQDGLIEMDEKFLINITDVSSGIAIGNINPIEITIKDTTNLENLNVCFNQEENSDDAVSDGWYLIGSNEFSRTIAQENFYKYGIAGGSFKYWRGPFPSYKYSTDGMGNTRKPYYAKRPKQEWRLMKHRGGFSNLDDPDHPNIEERIYRDPLKPKDRRLRLSEGLKDKKTGIAHNTTFPAKGNFVVLEFDYYSYGGCNPEQGMGDINPVVPYVPTDYARTFGGDGTAMVIFDAKATPSLGGGSGSLGYAQRESRDQNIKEPGFNGGWLAVGLDEYGNFRQNSEGKGGIDDNNNDAKCAPNNPACISKWKSNITIRGSGNGYSGYKFLHGTRPMISFDKKDQFNPLRRPISVFSYLPFERDGYGTVLLDPDGNRDAKPYSFQNAAYGYGWGGVGPGSDRIATDYFSGRYRLIVNNTNPDKILIRLDRSIEENVWKTIIDEFDAKNPKYNQAEIPENFKLAFTSSTTAYDILGDMYARCNIHEVGKIVIKANSCEVKNEFNKFRVVEGAYGLQKETINGKPKNEDELFNWKWNSPIRTRVVGDKNTFCVLAGNKSDESATQALVDKNITMRLMYDKIHSMSADGKYLSSINTMFITAPDAYNVRYVKYKDYKNGKENDDSTCSFRDNPYGGIKPRCRNLIKYQDVNGTKKPIFTVYGKQSSNKDYLLCFDGQSIQNASRNAYFYVQEENKPTHLSLSSDRFSLRPDHFKFDIYYDKKEYDDLKDDIDKYKKMLSMITKEHTAKITDTDPYGPNSDPFGTAIKEKEAKIDANTITVLKPKVEPYVIQSFAASKGSNHNKVNGYYSIIKSSINTLTNHKPNIRKEGYARLDSLLSHYGTTKNPNGQDGYLVGGCSMWKDLYLGKKIRNSSMYKQVFRESALKFEAKDNVVKPALDVDDESFPLSYADTISFKVLMNDTEWTEIDNSLKNFYSLTKEEKEKIAKRIENYGNECFGSFLYNNKVYNSVNEKYYKQWAKKYYIDKKGKIKYGRPPDCIISKTSPEYIYFIPSNMSAHLTSINDAVQRPAISPKDKYTYVANNDDLNMSADLNFTMVAVSADGLKLNNFHNGCWPQHITFDMNLTPELNTDRAGTLVKNPKDGVFDINLSNNKKVDYFARDKIWFGPSKYNTNDFNSSTTKYKIPEENFNYGEANASVSFNFNRDEANPLEPFVISHKDFNITSISMAEAVPWITFEQQDPVYSFFKLDFKMDSDDFNFTKTGSADGFSSRPIADNHASFFYGRVYTPTNYIGRIKEAFSGTTYYAVYCGDDCNTTAFPMFDPYTENSKRFPELRGKINWFVNKWHNALYPDGNVSNYNNTGNSHKTTNYFKNHQETAKAKGSTYGSDGSQDISKGQEELEFYSAEPGIDLVKMNASKWLIFNEDGNLSTVNFPVEFLERSNIWLGEGGVSKDAKIDSESGAEDRKVGSHVDLDDMSKKTNKRIEW